MPRINHRIVIEVLGPRINRAYYPEQRLNEYYEREAREMIDQINRHVDNVVDVYYTYDEEDVWTGRP